MNYKPLKSIDFLFRSEKEKFHFVLTLSKKLSQLGDKKIEQLVKINGIDSIMPVGSYSFEVFIARTFDPNEVICEINRVAALIQSDVIISSQKLKV